ncbi:MAG TPA: pyridoxamine 5'-phosphate oxidase family protein [Vicinamibacterales bacterium]|nr:pyridoxamine 5'-phosphate oxidase family protein [Vicinamibacterales bacterium]
MSDHASARARANADLQRLVDGIPVAMVTTVAADGALHGRPMLLERLQPDGRLTFLTHLSSTKTGDVQRDRRVNVAFVSDKGDRYVSIAGTAAVVHDEARMRELWNPTYRAWFPHGPDDHDSAIFTVTIDRVDYWDVPRSRMVRLWGVVKALATGEVVESGEHATITFGDGSSHPDG